MDSLKLLTGYADKLKQAQRELEKMSKKAEKLSQQQAEMDARRAELVAQQAAADAAIAELQAEDAELKPKLLDALMEDDTMQQRELKQRRKEVADAIRERESELEGLDADLEALGNLDRDAAALSVELEMLEFGNTVMFLDELRNSLRADRGALDSKREQARKNLPAFSSAVLESVKDELIDGYAEEKQAKQESVEKARQERERREQEARDRANTQHVGPSGYVDQYGEQLPRGAVDPFGNVLPQHQNERGDRRAYQGSRTVTVVR